VITVDQSVPPTGPPPEARPRRRSRLALALVLAVLAAGLAGASIRLPYYEIAPGQVLEVDHLVKVEEGPRYEARGSFEMVTVSLGRASVWDALRGWLDGDIDVVGEDQIKPPNVSDQQFTEENRALMTASKEKAQGVAFEALGEDAIKGDGALVVDVVAGSPADGALAKGDVIVAVDGTAVGLDADAVSRLGARKAGDQVRLTVKTGDVQRDVDVTLAARKDGSGKPLLGVQLQTKGLRIELPRKVSIDSEEIGGPSAGLAFTLQVLDELTPGELTGGKKVAATGTIELDGSVGEIGGIRQKTAAVLAAKADVFLVPKGEYAAAKRRAGAHLQVVPVETLDDALRALASLGGSGLGTSGP
jgi:PDZ domain-containing protein